MRIKSLIDNIMSYCGPEDEWVAHILAFDDVDINLNERICQFRIMPSQKATLWQKLKWFLSSGIEIEIVRDLYNDNRSGTGSTGLI